MPKATKAASAAKQGGPAKSSGKSSAGKPAGARTSTPKPPKATDVGGPKGKAAVATPAAKPKKAPAKRSPSEKQPEGPADKFLAEQRALLLAERATYSHQAASLRAEAEQLAEDMEPGDIQFDEESGEGATLNIERERDLALSAQAGAAVEEIDRALARIDAGTYGLCERCGQPIPRARLKALPYASLCVACKSGGLSRR